MEELCKCLKPIRNRRQSRYYCVQCDKFLVVKDIDVLLPLYKEKVREYLTKNNVMEIEINLTPEFLFTAESRIMAGNQIYGDDWRRKDNPKEIEYEKFDIFNYTILDMCQKALKEPTKPTVEQAKAIANKIYESEGMKLPFPRKEDA